MAVKSNTSNSTGKGKKALTVVAVVLAVLIVGALFTYTKLGDSGYFLRHTYPLQSEHYKVSNTMMSYYYTSSLTSALSSQNATYYTYMGLDTSKALKDQQYPGGGTWYDYFMQQVTLPNVKQMLTLAEAAYAEGYELTEKDRASIDEMMDAIKTGAKSQNVSEDYYVMSRFGAGIKVKDVRAALELSQLASSYSQKIADSFEFAESDWQTYLDGHKDDFRRVDYLAYTVCADDLIPDKDAADNTPSTDSAAVTDTDASTGTDAATDADTAADTADTAAGTDTAADTDAAAGSRAADDTDKSDKTEDKAPYLATASKYAGKIRGATSADGFKSLVEEYLRAELYKDQDKEKQDESVKAELDTLETTAASYNSSSEISKKLFAAKAGEVVVDESGANDGDYVIYFVTNADYIEEYVTKNAYVIWFEGDSDAAKTVSEINSALDADSSAENFAKLAEKYSDDTSGIENGALYENLPKTAYPSDEMMDWLYDDARTAGEHKDFTYTSGTGENAVEYRFIAQYAGNGVIKWQSDADSALKTEAYNEKYSEFEKAYGGDKITVSLTDLYKIPS